MAGETTINLLVKARDLTRRGLGKAETKLRGFAARTRQRFTRLRERIFSVQGALGALAGAGALTALAKKTFDLGADIEETANKYTTVFGPAVETTNRQMEEQARLLGLTDNEYRSLAGRTGAIAQGFGMDQKASAEFSNQILKTAGDLSSFNNVPVQETTEAINAALAGEREQLKRLGIVIRQTDVHKKALAQTGKENAEALTQEEKATASLALIQEKAGVAMGDLERTADSQANTARRLGAMWRQFRNVLATAALPVLTDVLGGLEEGTSSIEAWSESIRRNQAVITAWGRFTIQAIQFVGQSVATLLRVAFNLGQSIGNLLRQTFSRFVGWFARLVVNPVVRMVNGLIDSVNSILPDSLNIDFQFAQVDAQAFLDDANTSMEALKSNLDQGWESLKNLGEAWREANRAAQEAKNTSAEVADETERAAEAASGGGGGSRGGAAGESTVGGGGGVSMTLAGEEGGLPFSEPVEGANALQEGLKGIQLEGSKAEDALESFGGKASEAFSGALAGALLASEGMKKGFLGALAKMAAGKGAFYLAEAAGALARGILGDPTGFAAAKQYGVAAGMMFSLAGALGGAASLVHGGGGSGGGGATAGAASDAASRQAGQAGSASQPSARLVVKGGFLDMNDPRQARRLGSAISELSGRDVIVEGG